MMSQMHTRAGHPMVMTWQQSNRPVDVLIHARTPKGLYFSPFAEVPYHGVECG
jgi:hypothetical protein